MGKTIKIRYTGGEDSRELPDGRVVLRNHQVEVDEDVAGRSPEPRVDTCAAELVQAQGPQDHEVRSKLAAEYAGLDKGEGLLAQSDTWTAATATTKKSEVHGDNVA